MIYKIQNKLYFLLLSFLIILIDQLTKFLMFYNHENFVNKDFILFKLDFVKNYGAAFNIFNGNRIFLSFISILISIILFNFIFGTKIRSKIELVSYSFILGGTIGNGIDRILNGFVIDFINLNLISFPVFNFADTCISFGFLLILYSIFKKK